MAKNNNPSYEEVFWKVESKDTQIHGIDKPKIIGAIEVEWGGGSSWNNSWLEFYSMPIWASWTINCWGFWFTPTRYLIKAWLDTSNQFWASSNWSYVNWSTNTFYDREDTWATGHYVTTSFVVNVYDDILNRSALFHQEFTSDWIILNISTSLVPIKFTISAYS